MLKRAKTFIERHRKPKVTVKEDDLTESGHLRRSKSINNNTLRKMKKKGEGKTSNSASDINVLYENCCGSMRDLKLEPANKFDAIVFGERRTSRAQKEDTTFRRTKSMMVKTAGSSTTDITKEDAKVKKHEKKMTKRASSFVYYQKPSNNTNI